MKTSDGIEMEIGKSPVLGYVVTTRKVTLRPRMGDPEVKTDVSVSPITAEQGWPSIDGVETDGQVTGVLPATLTTLEVKCQYWGSDGESETEPLGIEVRLPDGQVITHPLNTRYPENTPADEIWTAEAESNLKNIKEVFARKAAIRGTARVS